MGQTTSRTGSGCSCGCGGHDAGTSPQQRAASGIAPSEEGAASGDSSDSPAPSASSMPSASCADPVAIAAAVSGVLGGDPAAREEGSGAASGVVPGHKTGNLLGLRDVSAPASGGCGCGGHGSH
ncbi:hypothetical protein [Actinomyces massiliensis]|uniref:hypothetical protein n=1 Tax=Actinomyces massiliensis TaxID=461393 RepID=UPI00235578B7|nr:hypothetical protein [Actinomyces massiliensis]